MARRRAWTSWLALAPLTVACGAAAPGPATVGPLVATTPGATGPTPSARGPLPTCEGLGPDERVDGLGSCTVDSDCELTSYQEGCCTQACSPGARSKADLARARAREDCAVRRREHPLCPPPAACSAPSHEPIAALCCGGTCTTARRRLAGATEAR